jgi:hypothetical protein
MKKATCLILLLCLSLQFSRAQTQPLTKYSAYRCLLSDIQKGKHGFNEAKFHNNYINLKSEILFSVYGDRIVCKNKKTIVYKIYKTKEFSDDTHYYAMDLGGQYYDIVIEHGVVNKKYYYSITVYRTEKNNNWLSVTRFDVNKVK